MPKDNTSISCPKCGAEINVSDILYHQVQEQLKNEYEAQSALKDKDYQKKLDALQSEKDQIAKDKEQISKDKESFQQEVDSAVKSKINAEKIRLEKSITEKLKDETSEQIQSLEKELEQKSIQVKELNKTKSEIEKLKREKDELRGQVELEKEREFSEKLKAETLKIRQLADAGAAMQILELKKQLEDQKHLAEEMKRKAEQVSMQLQGEVQELTLEEELKGLFPFDIISEVAKGQKGADVVQTVRNKFGIICGIILYESKRTKSFSNEWISKLKKDAVAAKADISIIVTETLPAGIEHIGQMDGIWICSLKDFKSLVLVLRESVIKINEAYTSQTNKGEKMQMLYDYLISTEFRNQVGAIVEGFSELQQSYIKEKQQMEKIWKQREKQLEKVLLNTNHFIGSIQGIAGSSLPNLQQIGEPDTLYELTE
jgi:hypothetical protein